MEEQKLTTLEQMEMLAEKVAEQYEFATKNETANYLEISAN